MVEKTVNKLLTEYPTIEDYHVYVAGKPALIKETRQLLEQSGLPADQMHLGQFDGGCISSE